MWPVNQPIPKIGSIHQTSGEAEYINDKVIRENEVFCAFTLAEAPGMFERIDFEEAMVKNKLMYLRYCIKRKSSNYFRF